MKKIRIIIAALLTALLSSCGNAGQNEASRELFAMDTLVSVKAYGAESEQAVNAAADRITELEKLLSVTDETSDIFRLNSSGSAVVSEETAELTADALSLCRLTGGALDISLYPVLREWGFTTDEKHVPTDEEIEAALAKTGYEKIIVEGDRISLPEGHMIDLGSCAKGRAGDEMIAAVSGLGVTSAIINLGGNVQTLGSKPDGSEWSVGIANPFSPNELLGIVRVRDKAVVTSGGYQRYFTDDDGNVYIHILDPETGRPADSGLASVTVIGDCGMTCDGLSTALFVMGKDKAVRFRRENGGFDMVLVDNSGTVFITPDIAGSFVNSSGAPVEIIYE